MDTLMSRTHLHLPEALRFVCSEDEYSVYKTPEGEEVYLAHGTGARLITFAEIDVYARWVKWRNGGYYYNKWEFLDHLRGLVIDPDEVDEIRFCDDCSDPEHADDLYVTGDGTTVCESCYGNYSWCERCEERFPDTTTTLDEIEVCSGCRARYFSWCSDCEGWYRDEYADDHDHSGDCCEAPAQSFTVRNDGEEPLANDTRVTVSLPAGVIDAEGMSEISTYLRSYAWMLDTGDADKMREVAYRVEELGGRWQTKEGNFTKRLSRFAYKEYAYKMPAEVISRVGCIARDHSTAVAFHIEVTRDLNLPAEEFYHEDSCWWSSSQTYSRSRCALKTNGGFGLRTFGDYGVAGRAWVMPLKRTTNRWGNDTLTPTFETREPDAFVVFNGYGDLEGYAPARIVAHMAGMTYRKIDFMCSPMYVNNTKGYLIAPEEIACNYTDGRLELDVERHADLYDTEKYETKKVLANV